MLCDLFLRCLAFRFFVFLVVLLGFGRKFRSFAATTIGVSVVMMVMFVGEGGEESKILPGGIPGA